MAQAGWILHGLALPNLAQTEELSGIAVQQLLLERQRAHEAMRAAEWALA